MTGTPAQIEWAEQIKPRVIAEFDRVAAAFEAVASKQADGSKTRAVIAILEATRGEVLAHDQAGYFIRNWGELNDQVRRMIAANPRYQDIKAARPGIVDAV